MSETIFKELEHLTRLSVALEGFDSLPKDATAMLNAFRCSSPSFESMTFGDKQVSMESIGSKIKELAIAAAKWIKVQIAEFIAFIKSGKLEITRVEAEVNQAEKEVAEARAFQEDEITLSPLITGYLAINGVLDRTFADNLVRVRNTLGLIFEMQPGACKLAETISTRITSLANDEVQGTDLIKDLAEFSQRYGRKLVAVDKSKTFHIGPNRASFVQVMTKAGIKVQDMTSLPLPGGYALVGTLMNVSGTVSLNAEHEKQKRITNIVEGLVKSIKPELVKVTSAGITFKGEALTKRDCNTVVTESRSIITTLKQSFSDDDTVSQALKNVDKSVDLVSRQPDQHDSKTYVMSEQLKILRSLVPFIEMNKSQLTRYSLKVIRAAVRYVHASIVPAEAVAPVPESNRLPAPAAV